MAKEELYIEAKLDADQLYADLKKLKNNISKQDFNIKAKVTASGDIQKTADSMKQLGEAWNESQKAATDASASVNQSMQTMSQSTQQTEQNLKQVSTTLSSDVVASVNNASAAFNQLPKPVQDAANKVVELEQELRNLKIALKTA